MIGKLGSAQRYQVLFEQGMLWHYTSMTGVTHRTEDLNFACSLIGALPLFKGSRSIHRVGEPSQVVVHGENACQSQRILFCDVAILFAFCLRHGAQI